MDKKIKARWVKALRSGKYKQGRTFLFDGERYCCLGVLCRVVGMKPKKCKSPHSRAFLFGMSKTTLPATAQRLSGLRSDLGLLPAATRASGKYDYRSLAAMNDHGVSFSKIADIIEREF